MAVSAGNVVRHQAAEREARRSEVMRLFLSGKSVRDIAEIIKPKVTHGTVHNDIKAVLKKQAKFIEENVPALRAAMLAKYDKLYERHLPAALDGDHKATEQCFKAMKSTRELLGLDAEPEGGRAPIVQSGKNVPAFSVTIHETNVLAVGAPGHGNGQAEAPQEGKVITVDVPEIEEK